VVGKTTAMELLASADFVEDSSFSQRLGLRRFAYPHDVEDATCGDCIPLLLTSERRG